MHSGLVASLVKDPHYQPIDDIDHNLIGADNLKLVVKHQSEISELVSLKQLLYFSVAPTLCYQLSYPRNKSIRVVWLLKRMVEYVLVLLTMFVIFE